MKKIICTFLSALLIFTCSLNTVFASVSDSWAQFYNVEPPVKPMYDTAMAQVPADCTPVFCYWGNNYLVVSYIKTNELEYCDFSADNNQVVVTSSRTVQLHEYLIQTNGFDSLRSYYLPYDQYRPFLKTFNPAPLPVVPDTNEFYPNDVDYIGFGNWLLSLDGGGTWITMQNRSPRYTLGTENGLRYILDYWHTYGAKQSWFIENRSILFPYSTENTEINASRLLTNIYDAYEIYLRWKQNQTKPLPVVPTINPDKYQTDITDTDSDDIYVILLREILRLQGIEINNTNNINNNLINLPINAILNALLNLDADIIAGFAKLDATLELHLGDLYTKLGDINTSVGDLNTTILDGNTDINNTLTNIETNTSTGGGGAPDIDYTDKGDFEIEPVQEIETELTAPSPDITDLVFDDIEDSVTLFSGSFNTYLDFLDTIGVKGTALCAFFVCFLINKLRGF